jgi:catechol-2,3-dioxygenase
MQIEELTLLAPDPRALQGFYGDVLRLPAAVSGEMLVIQAGATRLIFAPAPAGWQGCYHFAFNIAPDRLAAGKAWLEARVPLLRDTAGQDVFHSNLWDADQVYFRDPAGNILEWISRHTLQPAGPVSDPPAVLSISEIGLGTPDVPGTVARLGTAFGLTPYKGQGEQFTAAGDEQGLFIVVYDQRIWFPDTGTPAGRPPVQVRFRTGQGSYQYTHE